MNKIMEKKPQKRAKTTQNGYFFGWKNYKKNFFSHFHPFLAQIYQKLLKSQKYQ